MNYKRLEAEMFVNGITKQDLSALLNKSLESIHKIFKGYADFSYEEVRLIMITYFKNMSVGYIFGNK